MISVSITIKGKVQGVSFRYYTAQKAKMLGLNGFVKNLANGDVMIQCQGSNQMISQLTDWCRNGSPAAKVVEIKIDKIPSLEIHDGFYIQR